MKRVLVSTFVPLVFGCTVYASFPPFEVMVSPGDYRLKEVKAKTTPVELAGLREQINCTYGCLYNGGQSNLSDGDLRELIDNYSGLVKLERNSNLLKFSFDYNSYYRLFKFDRELLPQAFAKGSLPFLLPYTWELVFQAPEISEGKVGDKVIIFHEVAFSQFLGGNIVPAATKSDKFQHVQHEYTAGQMFIEQQRGR